MLKLFCKFIVRNMKHRSLGSDLLTVSAQELLQTLQDDKSSKINHEKTSPIF